MRIAIIDYGSGNLRSAAKAFEKAVEGTSTHINIATTPAQLKAATHIVLPGVGAFDDCMRGLTAIAGMREAMEEEVQQKKKPFLGICVGMQMLMEQGLEHGEHKGLGWLPGEVVPIEPTDPTLKVPHMGWNELDILAPQHGALKAIRRGDHAYFVHSYHVLCKYKNHVLATVDYGQPLAAIIGFENILGTQFHPEKSQDVGQKIIQGFLHNG